MGKLTDLKVKKATAGIHGDGGGLYLRVKDTGARSWVLRVQHAAVENGRRLDIGLGGYPADLSLNEARELAAYLRKLARQGKDARVELKRHRAVEAVVPTFAEAMIEAHKEFAKGWSDKHAASFKASLVQHVIGVKGDKDNPLKRFGGLRVDSIGSADIVAVLAPIWTDKPSIARKVRVRIVQVLLFAKTNSWREMPVPDARELRAGLARQPKAGNFSAMPFAEVAAFVADQLQREENSGRLALLFTILTAARSGEVRSARWEHIDIDDRTWNRPAELMKSREAHTVTLSDAALAILDRAKTLSSGKGLVFPGRRSESPLSDMTISKVLRTAKRSETVHGFRSAFRDWAAEEMPEIPDPVAEAALAHTVPEAVIKAYKRTPFIEMRRQLLQAWGRYVAPTLSLQRDNVVELVRTA